MDTMCSEDASKDELDHVTQHGSGIIAMERWQQTHAIILVTFENSAVFGWTQPGE